MARRVNASMAAADAIAIDELRQELSFENYAATLIAGRGRMSRDVKIFIGPPNSGKTYEALRALAAAPSGAYLAPLRLLALEVRDELEGLHVACDLITGEDSAYVDNATHVSSTIECLDTRRRVDTIVIDEAQMLFDGTRGWAWTSALLAASCKNLIILAAPHAEIAIRRLLAICNELPAIRKFVRKSGPLTILTAPIALTALESGDAIVSFARMDALVYRDSLLKGGREAAVIYGALPPDVRRAEAARFAEGHVSLLSATDAIGQGLNLPIKRIFFASLNKWNGEEVRPVSVAEVHQIAGRAGRFGLGHDVGYVGVLDSAESGALPALRTALSTTPCAPDGFQAPVMLTGWHVDKIVSRMRLNDLYTVVDVFARQLQIESQAGTFVMADVTRIEELAFMLDRHCGSTLSVRDRFSYATAPVTRDKATTREWLKWACAHGHMGHVGSPDFLESVSSSLIDMERAVNLSNLYLFLDSKFPDVYGCGEEVAEARNDLADKIATILGSPTRITPKSSTTSTDRLKMANDDDSSDQMTERKKIKR
jgi:ATP-dependent RNA helicase SUPV3L1/SUV3